jgi:hypothetical protein
LIPDPGFQSSLFQSFGPAGWIMDASGFSPAAGYPVSGIQYSGSRNISNDFHQDTLIAGKHFMQLKG